jgi:hypothetical protein
LRSCSADGKASRSKIVCSSSRGIVVIAPDVERHARRACSLKAYFPLSDVGKRFEQRLPLVPVKLTLASDLMRSSQQKFLLLSRHDGEESATALFLQSATQNSKRMNARGRRACGGGPRCCRPAARGPCCSSCTASLCTRPSGGHDHTQEARRARSSCTAVGEVRVPCVGVRPPSFCAHRTFGIWTSCIASPDAT